MMTRKREANGRIFPQNKMVQIAVLYNTGGRRKTSSAGGKCDSVGNNYLLRSWK